jgi:DNA-directed RNA polymerase subunit beta
LATPVGGSERCTTNRHDLEDWHLPTRTSSPERFSFSSLQESHAIPNLLKVQTDSFDWFLRDGLKEALEAISPIEYTQTYTAPNGTVVPMTLALTIEYDPDDDDLVYPPKFTVDECRQRAMTYSAPIYVRAIFTNSYTGEIKEQIQFMGDFPLMTEQGTFIINGTERVVVSQIVRSPGVVFQPGKDEKTAFEGTVHPNRGEWLQIDLEEKKGKAATAGVRIARKRRISLFTFLRALDQYCDDVFFETFVREFPFLEDQYRDEKIKLDREKEAFLHGKDRETTGDTPNGSRSERNVKEFQDHLIRQGIDADDEVAVGRALNQALAWMEIHRRIRPGEMQSLEAARSYFEGVFFSDKRYDLSRVGRYKLDRKLGAEVAKNHTLFAPARPFNTEAEAASFAKNLGAGWEAMPVGTAHYVCLVTNNDDDSVVVPSGALRQDEAIEARRFATRKEAVKFAHEKSHYDEGFVLNVIKVGDEFAVMVSFATAFGAGKKGEPWSHYTSRGKVREALSLDDIAERRDSLGANDVNAFNAWPCAMKTCKAKNKWHLAEPLSADVNDWETESGASPYYLEGRAHEPRKPFVVLHGVRDVARTETIPFRDNVPTRHPHVLRYDEALSVATYVLNLGRDRTAKVTEYHIDDQDHFGNRRVRSVGELIQGAVRQGLSRMERVVRERMGSQDVESISPSSLINIRPVMSAIKEFFAQSQLSQFMDQNNPLSGLTHKRRLSALGPGGLSRERAGLEVRDVHSSHYGRMCPIETPEGPNVGLIGYLATYARINEYGFIETPYRVVKDGKVTGEIIYYTADEEEKFVIAQANTEVGKDGSIVNDRVLVRRGPAGTGLRVGSAVKSGSTTSEIDFVPAKEVELMDVSPRQVISVATSLIPFVEHDDAQRALMGANMQKQAVPLIAPEAPFVGTGMEHRAAIDSGDVLLAEGSGVVAEVHGDRIVVKYDTGEVDRYGKKLGTKTYGLNKFRRSNQDTSINDKPLVFGGENVVKGDLLADGTSTSNGELALGKNLLVAYMPWEGYNYEDAIILNERLVRDDVLTSIHVKEYEIDARDTKLGPEEITNDVPNVPQDMLANLEIDGVIRVGAEVLPGDILVGKVTPKGETEQSPEERLLRMIFGEKSDNVRDTSLKVPHGEGGKVIATVVHGRDDGHELPPGVNKLVKVYVAQRRKISEGDKLAGRHGNKGVISKILPEEDMPFLPDGTPVDIILSPLGVPSRMNVGQVLESHLGYAARHGWQGVSVAEKAGTSGHFDGADRKTRPRTEPAVYVATPAFDGAHWDEHSASGKPTIQHIFANLTADGANGTSMLQANDGKVTLYNGRTGEAYDNPISVGYAYILKLAHMVDDKIHARSTGPYAMTTAQPLGGKAQFGGQRFGEMEVWALEAYGAAYALQELLTVKSDDLNGRERAYEAIVKGENLPNPGVPESFKVLIKEMQSLCLNVEVLTDAGAAIQLADTEEDFMSPTRALGINISRPERGSDEEDAAREAVRRSGL